MSESRIRKPRWWWKCNHCRSSFSTTEWSTPRSCPSHCSTPIFRLEGIGIGVKMLIRRWEISSNEGCTSVWVAQDQRPVWVGYDIPERKALELVLWECENSKEAT